MLLCPDQSCGPSGRGPAGTPPFIVLSKAPCRVIGHAHIIGSVRAFEDVAEEHAVVGAPRLAQPNGLARDKVRTERELWRRGESNPRPKRLTVRSLHAYPVRFLLSPTALRNEQ